MQRCTVNRASFFVCAFIPSQHLHFGRHPHIDIFPHKHAITTTSKQEARFFAPLAEPLPVSVVTSADLTYCEYGNEIN
jgi:hypothetical protein